MLVFQVLALKVVLCLMVGLTWGHDMNYDMPDYRDHPCNRHCEDDAPPRLCKYHWTIENYYVLSKACHDCPFNQSHCSLPHCVAADGVSRGIRTANRKLPGPPIEVCQGDTIEVTVYNKMEASEGTTIHWHGILQEGSQIMDGAELVTQCPITHRSKFTYKFKADNPGTHYWHSHAGVQRADGLFGSLVVRRPPNLEPHYHLYHHDLPEHVIIVTDWLVELAINRFAAHHHDDGDNKPKLMLINGMGRHEKFKDDNGASHFTPRATFTVQGGKKYRFRVISSAIMNCPIQISIDDHTMIMIASDGNSFEPFTADSFNIFAGERYDFVLYADKTSPLRNYWIRVRGLADCSVKSVTQTAILKYEGAPDVEPPESTSWDDAIRDGIKLNPWNTKGTDKEVEISRMLSTHPDDDTMTSVPDKKFYLAMDFNKIDNDRFNHPEYYSLSAVTKKKRLFTPQINHITSSLPSAPPLTQYDDVPEESYCNAETVQKPCDKELCSCVHRYQVALGDLVEVIVIDEGNTFDANHPMHLHGFKFRVVGMDRVNKSTSIEEIKEMDRKGELRRSTTKAPLKDTVTVPDGGYTIIRFRANNPGLWFFHCHIEFHAEIGMGLIFQVGTKEQMPKRPKNFPTCGHWKFEGYEDDESDDDKDNEGSRPNSNRNDNDNNGATTVLLEPLNMILFLILFVVFK